MNKQIVLINFKPVNVLTHRVKQHWTVCTCNFEGTKYKNFFNLPFSSCVSAYVVHRHYVWGFVGNRTHSGSDHSSSQHYSPGNTSLSSNL